MRGLLHAELTGPDAGAYYGAMAQSHRRLHDMATDRDWFGEDVLERFLRYARVHTTSDPAVPTTPSTERQFDLARMLEGELRELGLTDVTLDEHCNLLARLPGTAGRDGARSVASVSGSAPGSDSAGEGSGPTCIGLMAHVDTAPDFSGEGVNPQVHEKYDGGVIALGREHRLDPAEYPMLSRYEGETIITTDGSTLLGADDKAGIAEIMTAVKYLVGHPELPRPDLEIAFTPDEETGRGMDTFPVAELRSRFFLTVDGTDEGAIEAECFTAFKVTVSFTGYSIHPGSARGKLANAAAMAATFVSMLPRSESPEATDGRFGFYCATQIQGSISEARVNVIVRDFDTATAERRVDYLVQLAKTVEGAFPGGSASVETIRQYVNMADFIEPHPELLERLREAIRSTGVEPVTHQIRGGTDGARLSEKGIPTPNLFTGGQNLHGRHEWVALPAMVRAAKTLVNFVQLFASE